MTRNDVEETIDEKLVRPISYTSKRYYLAVGAVSLVVLWGLITYLFQLMSGLGVTGLSTPILWGMYITSFIFFIGISHAGTLISAILRVTNAEWRRPITRIAEAITVFALIVALPQIFFDLGRPDRITHMLFYGRIQSPLVWDLFAITTYLFASVLYLYVAMIPDLSIFLANRKVGGWRSTLYRILCLNWRATTEQVRRLELAIKVMAALVIPIAVTVHTVVSWAYAMTLRPTWHSTVFGPYFVTGAIYSGIGAIIIGMWFYRKVFKSEGYIREKHFKNLGWLLLVMNLALIYMTINHVLTDYYGGEVAVVAVLNSLFFEEWASTFWVYISCDIIIPLIILSVVLLYRKKWIINGAFVASIIANVGMFLERYLIIAPTLSRPLLPYPQASYFPTWVEFSILSASVAAFALLFLIFVKIFPPISVWEVKKLDKNLDLFAKLSTGTSTALNSKTVRNPLPKILLLLVVGMYAYQIYLIARSILIPIFTPEGLIVANEAFKIVALPITFVVSVVWLAMGYTVYQLLKITEAK